MCVFECAREKGRVCERGRDGECVCVLVHVMVRERDKESVCVCEIGGVSECKLETNRQKVSA